MSEVISFLNSEANSRRKTDSAFDAAIEHAAQVRLETHVFDFVANALRDLTSETVVASADSVDELLQNSSRALTGDDAVGQAYWKQYDDEATAHRAKLEFSVLAADPDVRRNLNVWASSRFDRLYNESKGDILRLPFAKRREFERLAGGQDTPLESVFEFREVIEVARGSFSYKDHIFCDSQLQFHPSPDFNSWERNAFEVEKSRRNFMGWFRNPPSGEDCITIPYQDSQGVWRGKSPDFVIFDRSEDGSITCSMVEPHDVGRDNSWCIARGFAAYAEKFDAIFSRIELTCERRGVIKRLDLCKPSVRRKVLTVHSNDQLAALFDT